MISVVFLNVTLVLSTKKQLQRLALPARIIIFQIVHNAYNVPQCVMVALEQELKIV